MPSVGLILTVGVLVFPGMRNTPPIQWESAKLIASVFQGGARSTAITFISNKDLENVNIFITPRLAQFVRVVPTTLPQISKDTKNTLELLFTIPDNIPTGAIGGTLQIKSGNKTIAQPLPITIDVISPQKAEEALLEFIVDEFGTSTPTIPSDQKFLLASTTPEIEELLASGTNLPSVFKLSSVVFLYTLPVDTAVADAIDDLLPLVANEGIRTQDIEDTLSTHKWHVDNPDNPILPVGETLTFFALKFALFFEDRDLDGRADFLLVIPDLNTHTILQPSDATALIARDFILPIGSSRPALTAVHELIHVLGFRTECGGGREWYLSREEEDFVSFYLQPLIQDIFAIPVKDTTTLNASVDAILFDFPNTENCLKYLDLTRPTPVNLETPAILE